MGQGDYVDDELQAIQQQIEELKAKLSEARRRRMPEPISDYRFAASTGERVGLSDLFGDKDDLIVIHNMGTGCVYCTLWADGFVSMLPHLENRAAFVLVSPDEPARQRAFAESRGWPFRIVSAQGTTFTQDMGYSEQDGSHVMPGFSALHKNPDGSIERTGHDQFGPGDDYAPVWRFFDALKGGVGDWGPKYQYRDE